jgi:hypothetical protein
MKIGASKRSQFAQALVELLDDAGFYTREEWGYRAFANAV